MGLVCSICGHKDTWLDCDCICHEQAIAEHEYNEHRKHEKKEQK